jgi:hypothetical protein
MDCLDPDIQLGFASSLRRIMMSGTKRQNAIRHSLRAMVPLIPLSEAQDVLERAGSAKMKSLAPSAALWLALTSHIRHRHTDYDILLADGYERDAARFFVVDDTDAVLTSWGCARGVTSDMDDEVADGRHDPADSKLAETELAEG